MIRPYHPDDKIALEAIHLANGLPEQCLPNFEDPLILHTGIVEIEGRPVISCSLRGTAELFLLVDHTAGEPEERWGWMLELREHMIHEAWLRGLDEMSCWIPTDIEKSFGTRLEGMGFKKSPWSCYTLKIEK